MHCSRNLYQLTNYLQNFIQTIKTESAGLKKKELFKDRI